MQNTFNAFWAGGEEILPAEGRLSICAQVKTNWRKWIPAFYVLSALRSLAAYSSTPHREHSLLALALLLTEWASAVQKKGRRGEVSELPRSIWRCRTRHLCSVKIKLFHNEHNMGIMTKNILFPWQRSDDIKYNWSISNPYDSNGVIQRWLDSFGEGLSVAHHRSKVRVSTTCRF